MKPSATALNKIFSGHGPFPDPEAWRNLISDGGDDERPETFLNKALALGRRTGAREFIPEIALLVWYIRKAEAKTVCLPDDAEEITVNPSLCLANVHWKHLPSCLEKAGGEEPAPGPEFVMVWKPPGDGAVHVDAAAAEDLLILKMIAEDIGRQEVARSGDLPLTAVDAAIGRALEKGIILAPPSRIRRETPAAGLASYRSEPFSVSPSFTLQWHITQACDLHCRHCYDRSSRSAVSFHQALKILDDLEKFCHKKHVQGRISFTGGNPLLHPDFPRIYRAAAERGFTCAILGNPARREQLEELVAVMPPDFFQVSLEGLPEYNDYIRGEGHYAKSMAFLNLLREMDIYSMVMLTLTKGNIGQVLPLGARLQGRANVFYWNRLVQIGEGAALDIPAPETYRAFLETYLAAVPENPVLGLKDNLINTLLHQQGLEPFGGCTGFGCGAAFNFLAVLSDGEVHACRKFPSVMGSLYHQSLEDIYDSDLGRRYRSGCAECDACDLHPVCGGCLACAYSHGLNVFEQKDPFCFMGQNKGAEPTPEYRETRRA